MTQIQKEKITNLRTEGKGYTFIANLLGISKDTVKSFCRRNNLGGQLAYIAAEKHGKICPCCDNEIIQSGHAKPKRFCSSKCRQEWWNAHPERVNKKAVYSFVCNECGRTFTAYGNSQRKYCSHECYISARFKGEIAK